MTLNFPSVPCPSCGSTMTVSHENLRYEECGLPYVFLKNIYTERCDNAECGNLLRTIPKVAELHRLLALTLIKKTGRLEPLEITFLRKSLGWSKADCARKMHVQRTQPTRWESDLDPTPMSGSNDLLLRTLVAMNFRIAKYVDEMEMLQIKQPLPHVHRTVELAINEKGWYEETTP